MRHMLFLLRQYHQDSPETHHKPSPLKYIFHRHKENRHSDMLDLKVKIKKIPSLQTHSQYLYLLLSNIGSGDYFEYVLKHYYESERRAELHRVQHLFHMIYGTGCGLKRWQEVKWSTMSE